VRGVRRQEHVADGVETGRRQLDVEARRLAAPEAVGLLDQDAGAVARLGIAATGAAVLDAKRLGKDVTAFIGVSIATPRAIASFEQAIDHVDEVLECHHVTGAFSLMLKVKTDDTEGLERVIEQVREIQGVTRSETMVVLSTHTERTRISLPVPDAAPRRRGRNGQRGRRALSPERDDRREDGDDD